eukprot:162958-Chlamydomonas_euryale.AAC.1
MEYECVLSGSMCVWGEQVGRGGRQRRREGEKAQTRANACVLPVSWEKGAPALKDKDQPDVENNKKLEEEAAEGE